MSTDPLHLYRVKARRMAPGSRVMVTPFNLGYCVGRDGASIPSPHTPRSVADQNYRSGVNAGELQRFHDGQRKESTL